MKKTKIIKGIKYFLITITLPLTTRNVEEINSNSRNWNKMKYHNYKH